jgi:hypothetical protein
MAEYRVICVVRGSGGDVEALGCSETGSEVMYDDRWSLDRARAAIEEGHRLYVVDPSTGDEVELEGGAIRPRAGERAGFFLDDLPECDGGSR